MSAAVAEVFARRLRLAAALVGVGLIVQAATLGWSHPTAFLVFAFAGCGLTALGILLYLWSLLTIRA